MEPRHFTARLPRGIEKRNAVIILITVTALARRVCTGVHLKCLHLRKGLMEKCGWNLRVSRARPRFGLMVINSMPTLAVTLASFEPSPTTFAFFVAKYRICNILKADLATREYLSCL